MPEQPTEVIAGGRPVEIFLWPENVDSWMLFLRCRTQWRTAGMAGTRTGLDYTGVDILLRDYVTRPRKRRERRFEIRLMEHAALDEWAKKAAEDA